MISEPLPLHPDAFPPATVAHVVVPYTVTFRDSIGHKLWTCRYPVHSARSCHLVR